MKFFKDILQSLLWSNGFTIQRIREFPENNINLLKLLLDRLPDDTSNFTVVQVGANDGKTQDPVHPLIMRGGWSGVLVEPIPNLFGRLSDTYHNVPNIRLENCAIAKENGLVSIYHVDDNDSLPEYVKLLASFDRNVILKQKPLIPNIEQFIKRIEVPAKTISSLLSNHGIEHIHLLQIDTEGFDYEVLKMTFQANFLPNVINFEHTHLSPESILECGNLLASLGYCYLTIGRDTIAAQRNLIE